MVAELKAKYNYQKILDLKEKADAVKPVKMRLGVIEGVYANGATTVQVAWWQHFGTKHKDGTQKIHPTYFMTESIRDKLPEIQDDIESVLYGYFDGQIDSYSAAVEEISQRIEKRIKARVNEKGPKKSGVLMHSMKVTYELD